MKTHEWSDRWDPASADHILLTHRDLRGVLASYQRVGWAFDIPDSYVDEHMRWRVEFCLLESKDSNIDPPFYCNACKLPRLRPVCAVGSQSAILCLQEIAHHDFACEDIIKDSKEQMRILAEALGLSHKARVSVPWGVLLNIVKLTKRCVTVLRSFRIRILGMHIWWDMLSHMSCRWTQRGWLEGLML